MNLFFCKISLPLLFCTLGHLITLLATNQLYYTYQFFTIFYLIWTSAKPDHVRNWYTQTLHIWYDICSLSVANLFFFLSYLFNPTLIGFEKQEWNSLFFSEITDVHPRYCYMRLCFVEHQFFYRQDICA